MKLNEYVKVLQRILAEEGGDIEVVEDRVSMMFLANPPLLKKKANGKIVLVINP